MYILGIETSCDETALAIIETREGEGKFELRVVDSLIHSQAQIHSEYGGVFPALAKREHGKTLIPLLKQLFSNVEKISDLFNNSKLISNADIESVISNFKDELTIKDPNLFESFKDHEFLTKVPKIDLIAVTEGPGLEPTLWVGINFAKILGTIWKVPVKPVNHMEGHVVGSLLNSELPSKEWQTLKEVQFPALSLLISGGHTELVVTENVGEDIIDLKYQIIGQTKDDAVGEAYDKVARLLGLPYPGGPQISRLAREAKENNLISEIKLPRPMINSGDLNFSFAGLKTAVLYAVQKAEKAKMVTENFRKSLALEFETSVIETIETKLRKAIEQTGAKSLIIGGGVSANTELRKKFEEIAKEYKIEVYMPSKHVSGDNALMIALAGALNTSNITRELKAQGTKRLGQV